MIAKYKEEHKDDPVPSDDEKDAKKEGKKEASKEKKAKAPAVKEKAVKEKKKAPAADKSQTKLQFKVSQWEIYEAICFLLIIIFMFHMLLAFFV